MSAGTFYFTVPDTFGITGSFGLHELRSSRMQVLLQHRPGSPSWKTPQLLRPLRTSQQLAAILPRRHGKIALRHNARGEDVAKVTLIGKEPEEPKFSVMTRPQNTKSQQR